MEGRALCNAIKANAVTAARKNKARRTHRKTAASSVLGVSEWNKIFALSPSLALEAEQCIAWVLEARAHLQVDRGADFSSPVNFAASSVVALVYGDECDGMIWEKLVDEDAASPLDAAPVDDSDPSEDSDHGTEFRAAGKFDDDDCSSSDDDGGGEGVLVLRRKRYCT